MTVKLIIKNIGVEILQTSFTQCFVACLRIVNVRVFFTNVEKRFVWPLLIGTLFHSFQRISGSEVGSGLKYFGVSLHSAGDLTADALIDVVVGSKGAATVFRQVCMRLHILYKL